MTVDDTCPCGFPSNDPTTTHRQWHTYWEYKNGQQRRMRQELEARFEQHIRPEPKQEPEQPTLL